MGYDGMGDASDIVMVDDVEEPSVMESGLDGIARGIARVGSVLAVPLER